MARLSKPLVSWLVLLALVPFLTGANIVIRGPRVPAAAPGATYTDNFNRTNESPIAGDWDGTVGSFQTASIVSSYITGNGGNWLARVTAAAETFANNQEASVVLKSGHLEFVGPAVRIQASDGSCYAAAMTSSTNLRIYAFTGTSAATLADATVSSASAGDVIKIRASGTTISAYKNGVLGPSVTDATLSSGQPGVWGGDSIQADDFQADDV